MKRSTTVDAVFELVVRYELVRARDGTWGAQAFVPGVTGFPLWDGVAGQPTPEAALRAVRVELRRRVLRCRHAIMDRDDADYAKLREDCAAYARALRESRTGSLWEARAIGAQAAQEILENEPFRADLRKAARASAREVAASPRAGQAHARRRRWAP